MNQQGNSSQSTGGAKAGPDGARANAEQAPGQLSSRILVAIGTWRRKPLHWRLAMATGLALVGVILRVLFLGGFDEHFVFVSLYPAVMIAAAVGGIAAGILASALLVAYVCVLLPLDSPTNWAAVATFIVGCAIMIAIAEVLEMAQKRLGEAERMNQNAAYLEAFIDQAPVAIAMFDSTMRYISVSARWKSDYRLGEDVVGRYHYDVFPEISEELKQVHRRALAGEVVRGDEDSFARQDGRVQWLRWEVRPWYRAPGSVGGIIIFSEDISGRKQAEAALRASEGRMRAIVDTALDAIVVMDERGVIQSANSAALKTFGYSAAEMVGQSVTMLVPDDAAHGHGDGLETGRGVAIAATVGSGREVEGKRRDGTTFPLDLTVGEWRDADGRRFLAGCMRDISARKHAEEALARAGRLEAVGRLAGGIAHDFNNLLAVITGNLELAETHIEDAETREFIRKALEASERGAAFNRRLLSFAGRRPLVARRIDLNQHVADMVELLGRSLGAQVTVRVDLAPNLWPVIIDAGEVDSALTNLAINARDAMPAGGTLTISTQNIALAPGAPALEPGAQPGDYVLLSVADTGIGMAQPVLQRAMEPFFTTKGPGKGTGLGLSSVFGLAMQSGGFLSLRSEVGKGTIASLYLPRAHAVDAEADAVAEVPRGNGETILVVEDDDELRAVTRKRLRGLNYQVIEASDVVEALRQLSAATPVALVFSDVVMPGGSTGHDLVRWITKAMPHVKVVLTSGYNSEDERGETPEGVLMLEKPYTLAQLARAMRSALEPVPDAV